MTISVTASPKRSLLIRAIRPALLVVLKGSKLLSVAKPILLVGSLAISGIAYAFWLGPWLAVLFLALLLIHEMGHVIAMRLKGFDAPTPVFIPFLGAAIFAPKFTSREEEAFVGFGGPLLGSIAALLVFALWWLLPKGTPTSAILLAGSYLGVFLNLFNLLPINPLDGGRVMQAVGDWTKWVGLFGLLAISILWHQPVVLFLWILVIVDLDFIPAFLRAVSATLAWIAMLGLMITGFSHQGVWVDVVDLVFSLLMVFISWVNYYRLTNNEEEIKVALPELDKSAKSFWLFAYLGIVAVLSIVMVVLTPLIHH